MRLQSTINDILPCADLVIFSTLAVSDAEKQIFLPGTEVFAWFYPYPTHSKCRLRFALNTARTGIGWTWQKPVPWYLLLEGTENPHCQYDMWSVGFSAQTAQIQTSADGPSLELKGKKGLANSKVDSKKLFGGGGGVGDVVSAWGEIAAQSAPAWGVRTFLGVGRKL